MGPARGPTAPRWTPSGPVRYELVDYDYWLADERWDRVHFVTGITVRAGSQPAGTVLVEMLDAGSIRLAVFPDGAKPEASFADTVEIRRNTW